MMECNYIEHLKTAQQALTERLLTGGGIENYTEYREIVGEIRGIIQAINIFNELRKKEGIF